MTFGFVPDPHVVCVPPLDEIGSTMNGMTFGKPTITVDGVPVNCHVAGQGPVLHCARLIGRQTEFAALRELQPEGVATDQAGRRRGLIDSRTAVAPSVGSGFLPSSSGRGTRPFRSQEGICRCTGP